MIECTNIFCIIAGETHNRDSSAMIEAKPWTFAAK